MSEGKPRTSTRAAIPSFSRRLLDPQVYYDLIETSVFSAICDRSVYMTEVRTVGSGCTLIALTYLVT